MKVHRTIRYRLHPQTRAKAHKLAGLAGACRYVWNHFVGKLRDEYKCYGKSYYSYYTIGKQFTLLRRHYDTWLQDYSANIVKASLRPIETAYKKFFKGKGGLPIFHSRDYHSDSFPLVGGLFKIKGRHLHIAKIGEVLLLGNNPYPNAVPKSGTVKKEGDNWYAYIVYEVEQVEELKPVREVGIDRNVGQITCSDGVRYNAPDTKRLEAGERHYQKMMNNRRGPDRRKGIKASNRWKRAKKARAGKSKKIKQVRHNWCHQVSKEIADNYSMVYLEKLNTKGMTKSAKGTKANPGKSVRAKSGLNRGILGTCWGKLQQCLEYKTNVYYVDPKYTSQKCSRCGHIDENNRRSQSVFYCTACGYRENADKNGANNILDNGILAFGNGATGRGGTSKTIKGSKEPTVARPVKRQMDTNLYSVDLGI